MPPITTARSLQDFSLVRTHVDSLKDTFGLKTSSIAFMFFALDILLSLQQDEIEDSITDSFYLETKSEDSKQDRGIDAIFIDSSTQPATIHLFNFKYTEVFKNTSNFYPATEIDKMLSFLNDLMQQDQSVKNHVNKFLFSKIEEIWTIFEGENPKFEMHICSNFYNGFEISERTRFERDINKYSNFTIHYHLMSDFISMLTNRGRKAVHGKIRVIDKNLFDKSDGDIRALVIDVDARDLLRLVIDDENLRDEPDPDDYEVLKGHKILEDAFEDNVRIYLKQRSRINQNIKETALSEDNHRFFYYNNGITITCDKFICPLNRRAPIVELQNIQIVNGGQTVHALFEAFLENSSKFENIDILCRIYETSDPILSNDIAQFTNSQNPVGTRDIKSNDTVQKKLEKELLVKGFYYERKKGQYQFKPKNLRIDAEKAGQVLMAYFNQLPSEAKDQKRLIFAEKYDVVFNDEVTADKVLLAICLFDKVENEKMLKKAELMMYPEKFDNDSFLLHSSYYLLYVLNTLSVARSISQTAEFADTIWSFYEEAVQIIRNAVKLEREELGRNQQNYNHRVFFKGNRPRTHIENFLKK